MWGLGLTTRHHGTCSYFYPSLPPFSPALQLEGALNPQCKWLRCRGAFYVLRKRTRRGPFERTNARSRRAPATLVLEQAKALRADSEAARRDDLLD